MRAKRPYSRPMGRDEILESLAQILAGLQLPISQRDLSLALGAAAEPYLEIRRHVAARAGNAWPTQDDFEAFLTESLELRQEARR